MADNTEGQEDYESNGAEKAIPAISRDFRITNTKVIGLLAALVIYIGTSYVNHIVNSPHSRIDALVKELGHVHNQLDDLSDTVATTVRNDKECEKYNISQQKDIDMLKVISGDCVNWRAKAEEQIETFSGFYKWYSHRERLPD